MKAARNLFSFWAMASMLWLGAQEIQGRKHFQKKQRTGTEDDSSSSSPIVPSDPYDPPGYDPSIFDVTEYGAIGDGFTDDTIAFREAWKDACANENSTLLVPSDGVFMIRSSIFSGPCRSGLVFQVLL